MGTTTQPATSPVLAEFLIREFVNMAMAIARSEFFKSQGMLDRCDVESNALSALVVAANGWINYCDSNGHDGTNLGHFAKYASLRIRGSITDESRKNTFASRWNISDYQKARNVGLEKPTSEIAELTGISESRIKSAIRAIDTDRSMRMSYELEDSDLTCPDTDGSSLVISMVINTIKSMPKTQQAIIALRYFKGMKLSDISDTLKVKVRDVAMLHADAVIKIRNVVIREIV